jgi:NDP-sugar pyrophosphorylase family protein
MRTLLICPSERQPLDFLSQRLPLSTVPLLGQSLLEYWFTALSLRGVTEATVLAHDRPELAAELVNEGQRWGLSAKVLTESRELTPAEALLKHATLLDPAPPQDAIIVIDHFPGCPEQPLFSSHTQFFATIRNWIPKAVTVDRVGVSETQPGIWVGCHSHVSPLAQLCAPCWVGQHVFVGERAIIGPGTILEDGCFVEPGAELAESWVGQDTFVGEFARLTGSLAWGSTLINWESGSAIEIADPFLLCALREPRRNRSLGWFDRLSELYNRNKGEVGVLWKHLLLHKEG